MSIDGRILEWLDENKQRKFPFTDSSSMLSDGVSIDIGTNTVVDAALYTSNFTAVLLTSIVVTGTNVVFNFSNSASFGTSTVGTYPKYIRNGDGQLLVVDSAVTTIPEGTHNFSNATLLDSVVSVNDNLRLGLNSLSVGSGLIVGDIELSEGVQIGLLPTDSKILITAGPNEGQPIECVDYFSYADDCANLVSYINGVSADSTGVLNLEHGNKLTVIEDPDNNRLFIGLDFDEDQLCPPPTYKPDEIPLS